jgi:hypothetical protein
LEKWQKRDCKSLHPGSIPGEASNRPGACGDHARRPAKSDQTSDFGQTFFGAGRGY